MKNIEYVEEELRLYKCLGTICSNEIDKHEKLLSYYKEKLNVINEKIEWYNKKIVVLEEFNNKLEKMIRGE